MIADNLDPMHGIGLMGSKAKRQRRTGPHMKQKKTDLERGYAEPLELSLPTLTEADLLGALDASGKQCREGSTTKLLNQVNEALHQYCGLHVARALGKELMPSRIAKRLESINRLALKLYDALGDDVVGHLTVAAERHGENIGGYPGIPPYEVDYVDVDRTVSKRTSYGGSLAVAQAVYWLSILQRWGDEALKGARRGVQTDPKRHKGDPAMREFIGTLAELWEMHTGERAGTGLKWTKDKDDVPDGPFQRFVRTLLSAATKSLPPEIDELAPTLRDSLNLSVHTLRHYIRQHPR